MSTNDTPTTPPPYHAWWVGEPRSPLDDGPPALSDLPADDSSLTRRWEEAVAAHPPPCCRPTVPAMPLLTSQPDRSPLIDDGSLVVTRVWGRALCMACGKEGELFVFELHRAADVPPSDPPGYPRESP